MWKFCHEFYDLFLARLRRMDHELVGILTTTVSLVPSAAVVVISCGNCIWTGRVVLLLVTWIKWAWKLRNSYGNRFWLTWMVTSWGREKFGIESGVDRGTISSLIRLILFGELPGDSFSRLMVTSCCPDSWWFACAASSFALFVTWDFMCFRRWSLR